MARIGAVASAALLIVALTGCGSSQPYRSSTGPTTTTSVGPTGSTTRAMATSGGLTVTLTASPGRIPVGGPVNITIRAQSVSAVGALAYVVAFGDGQQSANPVPQFCRQSGVPDDETWQVDHSYRAPGTYVVEASVGVNCGVDHAATSVTVMVGAR